MNKQMVEKPPNNEILRSVDLFNVPFEEKPSKEGLTPKNKLRDIMWFLEIQKYAYYDLDKDEIKQTIRDIKDNKPVSMKKIRYLQAAFTFYKNDTDFWKKDLSLPKNFLEYKRFLLNTLIRLTTNASILNFISPDNSEELINYREETIYKMARNNSEIDLRANFNIHRSLLFIEKIDLPNSYQNIIYDFIQNSEIFYRNESRRSEDSPIFEGKKELSYNHLLRADRLGTGIISRAWLSPDKLSEENRIEMSKLKDPEKFLISSLVRIGHDLLEDGKFKNRDQLVQFIKNIAEKYLSRTSDTERVANNVANSIERLDTNNYKNPDGSRNYEVYVNGGIFINEKNEEQIVAPLNFDEKLAKFSDICHNYQSLIKFKDINDKIKDKEVKEKIKVYGKFIFDNIELFKIIPKRISQKFIVNYEHLKNDKNWEKVFEIIITNNKSEEVK